MFINIASRDRYSSSHSNPPHSKTGAPKPPRKKSFFQSTFAQTVAQAALRAAAAHSLVTRRAVSHGFCLK
ncbi:hypothetical protein KL86DES1_20878 [uncultured Desulfovibrio sp.]|uniref:Uncharacterized protein n=1 Tax=uncultured Desulfovibrio sp. TaxID=167968 RepID=A0A212L5L0_9BACT|nr:hypothetical protein KL86DES1_20878 [uncultured Desulfovibrio sp.]VZH33784.1 conserved protein of unknown function [Desulfovibrio sp. 86]